MKRFLTVVRFWGSLKPCRELKGTERFHMEIGIFVVKDSAPGLENEGDSGIGEQGRVADSW